MPTDDIANISKIRLDDLTRKYWAKFPLVYMMDGRVCLISIIMRNENLSFTVRASLEANEVWVGARARNYADQ
jgi:hypothetical protein